MKVYPLPPPPVDGWVDREEVREVLRKCRIINRLELMVGWTVEWSFPLLTQVSSTQFPRGNVI